MPLMTASHFFVSSAGMIESNVVFLNSAFTPISFAISAPKSMSEPTIVEPWSTPRAGT